MLEAIAKELVLRKSEISNQVTTIYFGGGTPSLLSEKEINHLVELVAEHFDLADEPEITLEANPDDLTHLKIESLAQSRVNRLSIGVQSFFDEDLRYMNRAHNADEAKRSMELATKSENKLADKYLETYVRQKFKIWIDDKEMSYSFLGKEYENNDAVLFLALALDEKGPRLDTFLKTHVFNYNIIPGAQDYVVKKLPPTPFPTHIVLDKNSNVVFTLAGYTPQVGELINSSISSFLEK